MAPTPAAERAPQVAARPADRYGDRRRSRRGVTIVAVVCAVLVAAGLGAVAWGMLQPSADAEVGTFAVVDDGHVELVLEVTRPVGTTAVCTIEALGGGFGQVGIVDVTVEPADTRVTQVPVTMATSERATVVDVRTCRLP